VTTTTAIDTHFPGSTNRGLRRALKNVLTNYANGHYVDARTGLRTCTIADALRIRARRIALTAQGQAALDALVAS